MQVSGGSDNYVTLCGHFNRSWQYLDLKPRSDGSAYEWPAGTWGANQWKYITCNGTGRSVSDLWENQEQTGTHAIITCVGDGASIPQVVRG